MQAIDSWESLLVRLDKCFMSFSRADEWKFFALLSSWSSLVVLAIQVTIVFYVTIVLSPHISAAKPIYNPWKTCSKLAIKISSREEFAIWLLQSAFRFGHSTKMALIRITDKISFKMDNDEVTRLAFVDFQKSFWHNWSQSTTEEMISVWCQPRLSMAWF